MLLALKEVSVFCSGDEFLGAAEVVVVIRLTSAYGGHDRRVMQVIIPDAVKPEFIKEV